MGMVEKEDSCYLPPEKIDPDESCRVSGERERGGGTKSLEKE
jgi:hypothetical protein